MKNITLEDLLQKHFGLKGYIGEYHRGEDKMVWTEEGLIAYGKMTDFLFDLSRHVALHIDEKLANKIIKLVDAFDAYNE